MRKCALILGKIFLTDALPGHGRHARLLKRVPLSPVAQASQLHIRDERVLARPGTKRRNRAGMRRPERGVGIIGRIPLAIRVVVVRPVARLVIEPLGDVAMSLVTRGVAHKAQHGMLSLGTPAGNIVLLFEQGDVEGVLLRLPLGPGDVDIDKLLVFGRALAVGSGGKSHKGIRVRRGIGGAHREAQRVNVCDKRGRRDCKARENHERRHRHAKATLNPHRSTAHPPCTWVRRAETPVMGFATGASHPLYARSRYGDAGKDPAHGTCMGLRQTHLQRIRAPR